MGKPLGLCPDFPPGGGWAFWSADSRNGVPCFFQFSDGRVYCEKDMAGSVRLVRRADEKKLADTREQKLEAADVGKQKEAAGAPAGKPSITGLSAEQTSGIVRHAWDVMLLVGGWVDIFHHQNGRLPSSIKETGYVHGEVAVENEKRRKEILAGHQSFGKYLLPSIWKRSETSYEIMVKFVGYPALEGGYVTDRVDFDHPTRGAWNHNGCKTHRVPDKFLPALIVGYCKPQ